VLGQLVYGDVGLFGSFSAEFFFFFCFHAGLRPCLVLEQLCRLCTPAVPFSTSCAVIVINIC